MASSRGAHNFHRYFAAGVDLKALASSLIIPAIAGQKFLPVGALLHVRTLTGSLSVGPIIRIGNNGTHDNIAPLATILTTAVVDRIVSLPLVAAGSYLAIDIGTTGISVEVQTAAVCTTMTADIHLWGIIL